MCMRWTGRNGIPTCDRTTWHNCTCRPKFYHRNTHISIFTRNITTGCNFTFEINTPIHHNLSFNSLCNSDCHFGFILFLRIYNFEGKKLVIHKLVIKFYKSNKCMRSNLKTHRAWKIRVKYNFSIPRWCLLAIIIRVSHRGKKNDNPSLS